MKGASWSGGLLAWQRCPDCDARFVVTEKGSAKLYLHLLQEHRYRGFTAIRMVDSAQPVLFLD